ncbi:MAG: hypothetical protein HY877_02910, partial [Deltaproteobacteria bacterium]|nr:hypothetical protein [Deltaproteobacteria bacterium]
MKNKIALMVVVLSLLGCSDGVLKMKPKVDTPNPSVSPAEGLGIKSFAADPLTMTSAGEAKLTWEVTGADSIDIASSNTVSGFHFTSEKAEDMKSSTKVTVKETTTFTLSATKKEAPPVQKTVTITVKSALSIESFYAELEKDADKDSYVLEPGKQTVLHWSVLPAEAEISLTASTGEQPVLGECTAPSTKAMEAGGDAAPTTLPVSGCATVTPSEDTVYTLSAKLGEDKQEKTLSIIVGSAPKITLTATQFNPKPPGVPSVELDWQVSAKDAKVTLTSVPALPGLPVDQAVDADGRGSFLVPMSAITQPTTFTATAKVGDKTTQTTVVVSPDVFAFDCSQFVVTAKATGPVFVGEQVALAITAPQGAMVHLVDGSGEVVMLNLENPSIPAKAGSYTALLQSGDRTLCSKPVNLPVAELKKVGSGKAVRVVAADSKKPNDVYVGLDKGGFKCNTAENKCDKVSIIHYTDVLAQTMDVDFFTALKGIDKVTATLNPNFMDKVIKTFPVNAVAVSTSARLFAATTGGIFYKGNGKGDYQKWTALTSLLRQNNNGDYPGSHPTCFGQTQSGKQKGVK